MVEHQTRMLTPLTRTACQDPDIPCPRALMQVVPLLSFQGVALTLSLLAPLAAQAATVLSVGDGDTPRDADRGKNITNRVACIDAPEMAQSPYGQQAREALQQMLPVGLHGDAEGSDHRSLRADSRRGDRPEWGQCRPGPGPAGIRLRVQPVPVPVR